jgi:hypothetical protein
MVGAVSTVYVLTNSQKVPSDWQQFEGYVPVTNSTVAYYSSLNHNNSLTFTKDWTAQCAPKPTVYVPNGASETFTICVKNADYFSHPEHYAANANLLKEGMNASCLLNCNGVRYSEDPTITTPNEGVDFLQGKIFGVTHATTLVTTDYAIILGMSTSSTGISATDNFAAQGPCDSANLNTASNGGQEVSTTPTAGTPASSSVTTTDSNVFTFSGAGLASVQNGCTLTELHGGSHPYIFGEVAFGPDSFVATDTLTETNTWTVT